MSKRHYLSLFACGLVILSLVYVNTPAAPYQQGGLEQLFPGGKVPSLLNTRIDDYDIHYALMPGADGTPLVFIHGSPGDWQAWSHYLADPALTGFGDRLAVDRPGFGASRNAGIMTDLAQQAKLLAHLLPTDRPSILIAHSLGSPIAAWMAIQNPQLVCGVVSVAGSLAPSLEGMRWYNELATWKVLRPIIPTPLLDSNREIQALQRQLEKLDRAWPQLQRPLVVIQGLRDELVNPATAEYLEDAVEPSLLAIERIPDQGHFILWESPNYISDAIVKLNNTACNNRKVQAEKATAATH